MRVFLAQIHEFDGQLRTCSLEVKVPVLVEFRIVGAIAGQLLTLIVDVVLMLPKVTKKLLELHARVRRSRGRVKY